MKLYKHQSRALELTNEFDRCAYYLDMGLGKTFVGSEKMIRIGNKVNLVICQKSKIRDWRGHFATHYKYDISAYDLTNKGEWSDFWENPCGFRYRVGIINYELAWRRKELLNLSEFTLLLDESSLIQNRKAKQTKFVLDLKPNAVILLSGTPCSGKYENLWTQMHLLGWNISEDTYNQQYVNWKKLTYLTPPVRIVDKKHPYKNVERLKMKLRDHGAVFMKTNEVMSLPEQIFVPVMVPQSKEYKTFHSRDYCRIGDREFIGDTILTKTLNERLLCGAFSEEKIQAFKDLLNSTADKIVVFYNFNDELDRLKEAVIDCGRIYAVVNGERKEEPKFHEIDSCVLLTQFQAGAMGLNLQDSNKIIYYSLPNRSDLFEQSQKRIHRIGQEQTCFYYMLLVENSVETNEILPTLNLRKEWTDKLFQKGVNINDVQVSR